MPSALLLASTLVFGGPQAGSAESLDQNVTIIVRECVVEVIDEVDVPSRLSGVLDSVEVREGDEVLADQEVARLDAKRAQLTLDISTMRAKNDVNVRYAIKAADFAEAEYEKGIETNRRIANSIPAIEVERLRLSFDRGSLQIEQAEREYELEGLQKELDQATLDDHGITSPIDGIVVNVEKRRGEAVTAGELVFTVRNIDELRVVGNLTETEVPHSQLKKGQIVEFRADLVNPAFGSDKPPFRGKITYIEPGIDQFSKNYMVYALVKNNDARELLPGMEGTMRILRESQSVARQSAP